MSPMLENCVGRITGVDGPYSRELQQFFRGWQLKYAALNCTDIPVEMVPVLLKFAEDDGIALQAPAPKIAGKGAGKPLTPVAA